MMFFLASTQARQPQPPLLLRIKPCVRMQLATPRSCRWPSLLESVPFQAASQVGVLQLWSLVRSTFVRQGSRAQVPACASRMGLAGGSYQWCCCSMARMPMVVLTLRFDHQSFSLAVLFLENGAVFSIRLEFILFSVANAITGGWLTAATTSPFALVARLCVSFSSHFRLKPSSFPWHVFFGSFCLPEKWAICLNSPLSPCHVLHVCFCFFQSALEVELLWGQLERREKELNMSKVGARSVFFFFSKNKPNSCLSTDARQESRIKDRKA